MLIQTPPPPPIPKPIPVTIWVHGTRPSSFLPKLNPAEQKTVDTMMHAPTGLHKAPELPESCKHKTLTQKLSLTDSAQFPFEHMYVFGWSGDLDQDARKAAALALHMQLSSLVTHYELSYGCSPEITIITHSHGGNVILEMVPFNRTAQNKLVLKQLVTLACPVQKATSDYINDDMFEQIYALYSPIDMVQIMDPQRLHPIKNAFKQLFEKKNIEGFKQAYREMLTHPLFSERTFPSCPRVHNISVFWSKDNEPWQEEDIKLLGPMGALIKKITKPLRKHHRGLLHTEFVLPSFIKELPAILRTIVTSPEKSTIKI